MSQQPTRLISAAFGLVIITGVVHMVVGLSETSAALTGSGELAFGLLMVFGGLLAFALVSSYYTGVLRPQYAYIMGAGLMLLYITMYAEVHAIGTLESITGTELHAHDHNHDHNGHDSHGDHDSHGHDDESVVQDVIDHLQDDLVALGTKLTELTAAVLFVTVAVLDHE